MRTILIVDDESAIRYGLRRALEESYRIVEADSAKAARVSIEREAPDLVLLDVVLPGEDGLSFLRAIRGEGYSRPILIVSALDTAKIAIEALRSGANDYVVKGFDVAELRQRVANLVRLSELEADNTRLRRQLVSEGEFGRMRGASAQMRRVFDLAARVAASDSTVLIRGESGTGKDLLAQEIHDRSPRAGKPFIAVNCAALPEHLIESELFGYEKGAFTGASQMKKGKFELASSGTLFLDEIGDMNPVTQAKVLRALESRTIERLGGTQTIPVDVRVISATHRNLEKEISEGKFREDLYYRLRVVTLELPSLRERKEDIPALAADFLNQLGERNNRHAQLTHRAGEALLRYDWPGNVRELRNALERSLVLSSGKTIDVEDLPEEVRRGGNSRDSGAAASSDEILGAADFREAKRKFEIAFLKRKLGEYRWNVSRTAAAVGLHRQSLQEKLRELGIERPGKEK